MNNDKLSRGENASALIVAIEEYKCHPKLDKLGASANDLANVLEHGGFVDAYPPGREGKSEAHELVSQLKNWFADANSDQHLLLFWTGHGELESTRLYLMTQDSPASQFDHTNSVEPSFIAKQAALSKAKRILLVIDACHSGATIGSVVAEIANVINEQNPEVMRGRGIALIASVHAIQKAQAGIVCRLLKDILIDASLSRRWSDSDKFIDADRLSATLDDEVERLGIEQVITPVSYGKGIELIPNPRYRDNLPAENVEERLWRLARSDAAEHFELAARGIEVGEKGWFFSGRKRLLGALVDWLSTAENGVRIVTGPPGAGKSAVMGRIATLSDAQYRQEAIDAGAVKEGEDVIPPVGTIDVAVHAKGKTIDDCARALAKGLGVEIGQGVAIDLARLVADIGKLDRKITVMVDALDEAAGGQGATIASRLIVPLGRLPSVRVILGTRRSLDGAVIPEGEDHHGRLRAAFGENALVDDLADEPGTQDDIATYVRIRLKSSVKHRNDNPDIIAAAADRVATRADGIFLYARIVSRTLQDQDQLVGDLPATALEAFEQDLRVRFKGDERRVNDLLGALAWGKGKGLTRRVWPLIVNALAVREHPYDDDDIAWVLGHAGWHIIEAGEDGQAVYRLAHQALADHYHGKFDEKETQGRFVTALTHGIAGAAWLDCDHYLWRHLADHAAKAGRLDELLRDPGYLAVADPTRLVIALPSVESAEGRRYADIYDRVVDRLVDIKPIDRMPLIHLTAQMEDPDLGPGLEPPISTRWKCRWARVRPSMPHRVIGRHDSVVTSVAFGAIDGRPAVASGSWDETVRLWDARTGAPIGAPLERHTGSVNSVALGVIDGRPVVVSGSADKTIRLWEARTGEPIGAPLEGHTGSVYSVAFGVIDGRPVVISGSWDKTLRRWDARTGAPPIGAPFEGHTDRVASVAFGAIDGRPAIVSGSDDKTIRLWEARTGAPIGAPLEGHTGGVTSVAFGAIDGWPAIVSGSDDKTIRLWEARTGAPIGAPLEGHTGGVTSVAFGAIDGWPVVVSGSGSDDGVRLWEARTGEPIGAPLIGHTGWVSSVAFGVIDGRPVVVSGSGDDTVRLWEARTGAQIEGHTDNRVTSVAFGAIDGRPVVVSGSYDETIRLWDARSGAQIGAPFEGHTDRVASVAFAAIDGRPAVVSGSWDGTIRLWEARSGAPIGAPLEGHTGSVNSVAFAAIDGRPVVVSGSDDTTIRLWDARTGAQIGAPLKGHADNRVTSVAFGAIDGRPVVVSGSYDETIRLWEARTGEPIGAPLKRHTNGVTSVAFGRIDGRLVVVSGSEDKTIRWWDARTGDSGHSWAIMIGEPVESICTDDGTTVVVRLARGIILLEAFAMP